MTTKKHFKYKFHLRILVWALLFLPVILPIHAQQNNFLNVNIVVRPPISSTYSEYEDLSNKVIITVTNISGMQIDNVALHGNLKLGSDFFIATRYEYAPSQLMSFAPGETKTIISDPIQLRFLHRNAVDLSSFAQEIINSNQLPDGNWELCVEAFWFMDNVPEPISNLACFPLNITRAAPPVITAPFNEQVVPALQPNVVFAWTPPVGNIIGAQLAYDLYAVKIMPGQSPNDAMDAAVNYKANNPFVKTSIMGNQYVTQPFDLKLDTGYTYAVQVIARDVNKKVAFQNNGRSEVVTFRYGDEKQESGNIGQIMPARTLGKGEFPVTINKPVPRSQVKGKLYSRFKYDIPKTSKDQYEDESRSDENIKFDLGQQLRWEIDAGVPFTVSGGEPVYNTGMISLQDAKPLAGKKISLVVTYLFTGNAKNFTGTEKKVTSLPLEKDGWEMGLFPAEIRKVADKVLATTTTGSDGSFTFDFTNAEKELGMIDGELNLGSVSTEFASSLSGKLYKVLRIRVEDKYYCSPEVNIKVDPYKGVDVGNLVSFIKSYNLRVKVGWTTGSFWEIEKKSFGLSDVTAAIGRKMTHPEFSGSEKKQSNFSLLAKQSSLNLLDEGKTNKDGFITFYNLVQHDPDKRNDYYIVSCFYDEKGQYSFNNAEKKYYPHGNVEKEDFPYNDIGEYKPSTTDPGLIVLPVQFGESITWNSQLKVRTYAMEMSLYPAKPVVSGKISDALNPGAAPFKGINVVMLSEFKRAASLSEQWKVVKTDDLGHYRFDNLSVEWDGLQSGKTSKIIGPKRKFLAKPKGYRAGFWPGTGDIELKWGQQINNAHIELYADGWLRGYVEDENGRAVESDIDISGFVKTKTKPQLLPTQTQGDYRMIPQMELKQVFSVAAPSGTNREISIEPIDRSYSIKDTIMNVVKGDGTNASMMKFVVYKAQKRIRFQVLEDPSPGKMKKPGSYRPIQGATVRTDIPGVELVQTTDQQGYVQFVFENMAESFTFLITPPPGTDFENGTYTATQVKNTTQIVDYGPAYLRKSATIAGTVTVGAEKQPLQDASVYLDMGDGKRVEAKTDHNGKYILRGVPTSPNEQKVWASKPGVVPNIISRSQVITIAPTNTLDFNLQEDKELLIETIYGFDVDIQTREKQSGDTWLISGSLINLSDNGNFSLVDSEQTIPFADLVVKKSTEMRNGVPVGVPVSNEFPADLTALKLMVHQSYGVVQIPENSDVLYVAADNNKGKIKGKIAVQKSNFSFSNEYINFNQEGDYVLLLTDRPGSTNTYLSSIEAENQTKNKFGVADLNGGGLNFSLIGFKAKADNGGSSLEDENLVLSTVITVENIAGMNPSKLDISLGDLTVRRDGFETLTGNNAVRFNLEKWEFIGDNWQIQQNNSGIMIQSGTLHTGLINVGINNTVLKPNTLEIGEVDIKNLTFSEVVPLNVVGKSVFGYNKSVSKDRAAHWELRIVGDYGEPGVTINALPGMKQGESIEFQSFSLISNGEQNINPGSKGGQAVTFYDVMKVRPVSFTGGDRYFELYGGIDLDIPQVSETYGTIRFAKPSNEITFKLFPLNIAFEAAGGVHFYPTLTGDVQTLAQGRFTAMGTIEEKEGLVLKTALIKTPTAAWIEVNPKNQKLTLGSGFFADIEGKMESDLTAGSWKNLVFSGDMQGFKGMETNTRKTFTVTGSINATNQKIDVKNIPTGFGNININYDIQNNRFIGDLKINQKFSNIGVDASAELLVDPGGWYFLAGGNVDIPFPIGKINAGILFGDYNRMGGEVTNRLMQYSYDKEIPPSFRQGVSGFFFTGRKNIPLEVPDINIDLKVVSFGLGAEAGLDARLWMDFGNSSNEYGIGMMAFIHAFAKGGVDIGLASAGVKGDLRVEQGVKGAYQTQNGAFALKGCGSVSLGISYYGCVRHPCAALPPWCKKCTSETHNISARVDLLVDSSGNKDFTFHTGNCSGQPQMTGGW